MEHKLRDTLMHQIFLCHRRTTVNFVKLEFFYIGDVNAESRSHVTFGAEFEETQILSFPTVHPCPDRPNGHVVEVAR